VLDVHLHQALDQSRGSMEVYWRRVCDGLRVPLPADGPALPERITRALTFESSNPASIMACIAIARENTRQARQEITSEMWEQVNRLYLRLQHAGMAEKWMVEPHECYAGVLEGVCVFQGITDDTMTHGEGWHFIQLGRYIERAESMAALLDTHIGTSLQMGKPPEASEYLEMAGLLESCAAFEAFCKVYSAELEPTRIAQFLLFDAFFPRSLRYCAHMIQTSLQAIGRATGRAGGRTDRMAGRLRATLDYAQMEDLQAGDARAYLRETRRLCTDIHGAVGQAYIAPHRIPDDHSHVYPPAAAVVATADQ
jgi:uncharacterized alpha-E superfamily protein